MARKRCPYPEDDCGTERSMMAARIEELDGALEEAVGAFDMNVKLRARVRDLGEERDCFERDAKKAHDELRHTVKMFELSEALLRRAAIALPGGELRDEIVGSTALAGKET